MPALNGYRLYRGVGGLGTVDFDNGLVELSQGAVPDPATIELVGEGHAANTVYTYVLRPVLKVGDAPGSELETPDYTCRVEVSFGADSDWEGARPAAVRGLNATVIDGGKIRLQWTYETPRNNTAPSSFSIWYGNSLPVSTAGAADATETFTRDGRYEKDITLSDGLTYFFAVEAISATAVKSLTSVTGPVVADDTDPGAPIIYTGSVYA